MAVTRRRVGKFIRLEVPASSLSRAEIARSIAEMNAAARRARRKAGITLEEAVRRRQRRRRRRGR